MAEDETTERRVPFKEQHLQKPLEQASKSQSFVVDFGGDKGQQNNLQDAFMKYRKGRQDELRQVKRMQDLAQESRSDPDVMWALRMKFLEQIKKYFGVPYAKKYWTPEEEEYNSPIFLDCCGLVRRAMRDLEADFGFSIGQWNQAYQYDTLPNTMEEHQMLPGDLVFIAATYCNPKSKKQRHDMVHVEIWLGDGPKTIGARWQRGKVQVFDSYDFVAKSYHSQKYIFKSIDTWLMGVCRSYCEAHPWRKFKYDPSAKSVFAVGEENTQQEESDADEDAGDTDDELICSFGDERDFQKLMGESNSPTKFSEQSGNFSIAEGVNKIKLSEESDDKENNSSKVMEGSEGTPQDGDNSNGNGSAGSGGEKGSANTNNNSGSGNGSRSGGSGGGRPVRRDKKSPDSNGPSNPRGAVRINLGNQHPTFYIGGGNGVSLVEAPLLKLGWKRITDKHNEYYKLKWTECKSQINYSLFREGEQLVNHIPNCNLLTNKLGLLSSLQEYNRVSQGVKRGGRISMDDFVPETYRVDDRSDKKAFLDTYKDGEVWICKPTGMNQGKGIYLISKREEIDELIKTREEKQQNHRKTSRPLMTRIIQRYIKNPLLLDGHKFDIRAYMHIASTVPYVVLYHKGYIRRTCQPYTDDISDLAVHLTNQFVQKKVESYKDNKDDTVWSMEQFNDYINDNVLPEKEGLIEKDWANNVLPKIMQKIMLYCFNSVKHKLQQRLGYFELFGFDFMIDTDMRVWLIEVNTNPALHSNCEVLREVLPPIVEESLYISVELFEKKKRTQPILPVLAMKNYTLMFHDDHRSPGAGTSQVFGPPIVSRCQSSMQRNAATQESKTEEAKNANAKSEDKDETETKDNDSKDQVTEPQQETQLHDCQSSPVGAANSQQHPTSLSKEPKLVKPALITKSNTSFAKLTPDSFQNVVTNTSSVTHRNDFARNKVGGGTNTRIQKAGWPSFMNKITPRTLSSGATSLSLTPVTLNATPVSLKMTHVPHEHKRPNTHRTLINKCAGQESGTRPSRPKSKMHDRSS